MGPVDDDRVFERVQTCLGNLVSGSGHLASYRLDRGSFDVVVRRDLDGGLTEYGFTVDGVRLSEFDEAVATSAEGDGATSDHLEGTIVLDDGGALVTDDEGHVRLSPWRTLDPEHRSSDGDGLEALLDGLDATDE